MCVRWRMILEMNASHEAVPHSTHNFIGVLLQSTDRQRFCRKSLAPALGTEEWDAYKPLESQACICDHKSG
jgi:hypothetical protein